MEKTWNCSNKLAWLLVLLITILINQQPSSSARLLDAADTQHSHPQHDQVTHYNPTITFFMEDVLYSTDHPSSKSKSKSKSSSTTQSNSNQLPYPNYLSGHFHPINGGNNPLPKSNPTHQSTSSSNPGQYQTFDTSVVGLSFPAIATLQGLEPGTLTHINELLIEGPLYGSSYFGKAKGVYVKSLDDDEGHMMAMNVKVASNGYKDSLKFFGVHRTAVPESHIAVIGGTGKFSGANGYATVKTVTVGFNDEPKTAYHHHHHHHHHHGVKNLLMFTVYLSH